MTKGREGGIDDRGSVFFLPESTVYVLVNSRTKKSSMYVEMNFL